MFPRLERAFAIGHALLILVRDEWISVQKSGDYFCQFNSHNINDRAKSLEGCYQLVLDGTSSVATADNEDLGELMSEIHTVTIHKILC